MGEKEKEGRKGRKGKGMERGNYSVSLEVEILGTLLETNNHLISIVRQKSYLLSPATKVEALRNAGVRLSLCPSVTCP